MKLIDKEELIETIKKSPVWTGLDAIARINAMPFTDIVRCKECRYWNTKGCRDGVGECEWAYYMTKPDDFCSYGEREGE